MARFRVGIIGCGGMGRAHAAGYKASPDCELVAAADIASEKLDAFRKEFDVSHGYLDYRDMLAKESLDIVSVALWPKLHAPVVAYVAQIPGIRAIHCEKPMAFTWGEAKEMVAICDQRNVQLTIGHQRRFGKPFRRAKQLLDSGAIGQLVRLEAFTHNLYDWGTHWFDMMFFYNDDKPAEWVMGQIDARGGRAVFGVPLEGQGISLFKFCNGVLGFMATGQEVIGKSDTAIRGEVCENRLIGSDGTIEVLDKTNASVRLRSVETGGRWQEYEEGTIHGQETVVAAILGGVIEPLKTGKESIISAHKALQGTEVIFATYESSRRRGRVDLPLEIEDSPFHAMLEAGLISADS